MKHSRILVSTAISLVLLGLVFHGSIVSADKTHLDQAEKITKNTITVAEGQPANPSPSTRQDKSEIIRPLAKSNDADSIGYELHWLSINTGGGISQSDTSIAGCTAGEIASGVMVNETYRVAVGVWSFTPPPPFSDCDCGKPGDVNNDAYTDPLDVTYLVNFAYKQIDNLYDYQGEMGCPMKNGDVNCDGYTDPLDVTYLVNFAYKQIDNLCQDRCAGGP